MTFKFWPTIWMKPKSVNLNSNAFWTIIGKILQNRTIWAQKVQALAILTKINHRKLLTQIGQNAIFFQIGLCNINVDQLPKRVTSTKLQAHHQTTKEKLKNPMMNMRTIHLPNLKN